MSFAFTYWRQFYSHTRHRHFFIKKLLSIVLFCFQFVVSVFNCFSKFTEPIGGEITVACEVDMIGNSPKTAMEKALAEQLKTSKFSEPGENSQRKGCYYTPIPRLIKHEGICAEELTSLNLDKVFLESF